MQDLYIESVTYILHMLLFNTHSSFLEAKMDGILTWFCMKVFGNVKLGFNMRNKSGKAKSTWLKQSSTNP